MWSLCVQVMHRVAQLESGSQTGALSVNRPLMRRTCCCAAILPVRECSTSIVCSHLSAGSLREIGSVLSVSRLDILLAEYRRIAKQYWMDSLTSSPSRRFCFCSRLSSLTECIFGLRIALQASVTMFLKINLTGSYAIVYFRSAHSFAILLP